MGFKINLDTHHINHANSKLTITPNYPEFGIEIRYIIKNIKELSVICDRLINQNKFNYQFEESTMNTVFSARFVKQGEDIHLLDEADLFIVLNINHNLKEADLDKIDKKSPLEHQIQQQEMKDFGWRFVKTNSMTIYFYQTGKMNGSKYVKIPLRSNAILNIENNDKNCFLWSKLAYLHPCNNNHPNRVSVYNQFSNELNIGGFDFNNGFKCCDVHRFNELINLSINIFD